MKKTAVIIVFTIIILGLISTLLWYNRSIFNDQPILNNENYQLSLDTIMTIKSELRNQKVSKIELEQTFINLINNKVIPYWYGTKWDFNGTTQTPNEGYIACGYFVTTTLRDMGVPINRIKMAQCASEQMIKSLVSTVNIKRFSNVDIDDFEKKINELGNGLYVVGLDNHTGFLLISSEGSYFIHSSGVFPFQVVKEKLTEAPILMKSKYRVLGKISSDKQFLSNWINNKKV